MKKYRHHNRANKSFIIFTIMIFSIISIFACTKKAVVEEVGGHFEKRNGVDTYIEEGQVIIDSLVMDDGKLYYTDGEGHKKKDSWEIIDNDGNYGYFGSLGDLVVDRIREINGKTYYFDKNGKLYTDKTGKEIIKIEGKEYVANALGELKLATGETIAVTPTETTTKVASTTKAPVATVAPTTVIPPTTIPQVVVPPETNVVISQNAPYANMGQTASANQGQTINNLSPAENGGPGVGIITPNTNNTNTNTVNNNNSTEVKILRTEKVIDTVDGDDYECTITLLKPIMQGKDSDETMALNASIDEVMDAWYESVEKTVDTTKPMPKAVTFTTATLGTVKKTSIIVNITGTIKPKSGSTKTTKYRITYDREGETAQVSKIS